MLFSTFFNNHKRKIVAKILKTRIAEDICTNSITKMVSKSNKERLSKVIDSCINMSIRELIAVSVAYAQEIQHERITRTFETSQHQKHAGSHLADIHDTLFNGYEKISLGGENDLYSLFHDNTIDGNVKIPLDRHGVITATWNLEGLKVCMSLFGASRPWLQQSDHQVVIYWPIPMIVIYSGNHSFAAGVLNKDGIIENKGQVRIHDISNLYDVLECDGNSILRKADKSPVGRLDRNRTPWDLRWGILFELGRLIAAREGWRDELIAWCSSQAPYQRPENPGSVI